MQKTRTLPVVQILSGLLLLAWPFVIVFGLAHNTLHWLLPIVALLLILRVRKARRETGPMRFVMQGVAVVGIVLCVASTVMKTHQLLLFYPVVVNVLMLTVFGGSLWTSMPLVERLARLQMTELPPHGVRYTRRVTQVWCLFFIFNGSISLLTVLLGDIRIWTVWNGMVAYLLMAGLMAAEWLVRRRVMKREMF